jgi:hypothetical protein
MPPRLTYSTTASSNYTIGGTTTDSIANWDAYYRMATTNWTPSEYSYTYNYRIPDDPLGIETAEYRWSNTNAAALQRAIETLGRELRKEPDQNKIKELL